MSPRIPSAPVVVELIIQSPIKTAISGGLLHERKYERFWKAPMDVEKPEHKYPQHLGTFFSGSFLVQRPKIVKAAQSIDVCS